MNFNDYTWKLYKQTPAWEEISQLFSPEELMEKEYHLFTRYNSFDVAGVDKELFNSMLEDFYCYNVSEHETPQTLEEAKQMYESILSLGLRVEQEELIRKGDYQYMLRFVPALSFLCYFQASDFFFPYLFRYRAFDLYQIADRFDIQLPQLPKKADYKARCMYYWDLCETLYNFRIEHKLSPVELCAFLYDFSPSYIESAKKGKKTLPQPAQAWCIGGLIGTYDQKLGTPFWQGNAETRRGDVLIHYETSPISAITRLWISQTDGVIDPFFQYYANVYLGGELEIPHITLQELKEDRYFANHPLVRKNFQGVNGWHFSSKDYSELIRIIQSKGFDVDLLPKIYAPTLPMNVVIKKERDVEKELLERTLNEMGLFEGQEFTRQVPIQSGRGTSIYPDYVIGYNEAECKCSVMIEAKYHMKSSKELSDAFNQARSYARILQAKIMVLCDKEYLIVYEGKEGFNRNNGIRYYWSEMSNPDKFNELKKYLCVKA